MTSTHAHHARRITIALFVAQSLGSAGSIAAATVASIVGAELSGVAALAGSTPATHQVGIAASAILWATLSDRLGRRRALAAGLIVGAVGAATAVAATVIGSFALLLLGLLVMGSGSAAVHLGRFAAAEVHPLARRGRAVATVVLGGTVGSVLGPSLVAPTGTLARSVGWNELAGPYIAVLAVFLLASIVIAAALRPDPKELGEALARAEDRGATPANARPLFVVLRDPSVVTAIVSVVTAHAVMVALMQMTSLHMREHAHSLAGISIVFSSHTFGMFAFSVVSGWLADRWGRTQVIALGSAILVASCLAAPLSPALVPLAVSLFGLGIGWNLCYVAGSALLSDALTPAEKARIQGINDLLVGGVAAASSLAGGVVFAFLGYGVMGLVGAGFTAPLMLVVLWYRRRPLPATA